MRCPKCADELPEGATFCLSCRAEIDPATLPPSPVEDDVVARIRQFTTRDEAIFACQQALVDDSNNAALHALMGELYEAEGNLQSALFAYKSAAELDPGAGYRQRIDAIQAAMKHAKSKKKTLATPMPNTQPKATTAPPYERLRGLLAAGQLAAAREVCNAIVVEYPDSGEAHLAQADCLRAEGQLHEAMDAYRLSIQRGGSLQNIARQRLDEAIDALHGTTAEEAATPPAVAAVPAPMTVPKVAKPRKQQPVKQRTREKPPVELPAPRGALHWLMLIGLGIIGGSIAVLLIVRFGLKTDQHKVPQPNVKLHHHLHDVQTRPSL